MKICHVNLAKHFRGGERQTELLIRELATRGHSQRLIIRRGNELRRRCADVPDLEIAEVASNAVSAALATRHCALVHAHEARGVYAAWLASLLYRIPYVITRRVLNPQRPSFLRDRAYKGAKSVAVISQAVAAGLEVNYPQLQTALVPDAHAALASDPEHAQALRDQFAGKYIIGNVAALDPAKGQMTLVDAAKAVQETHPDWHFLICGSGPDEQRLLNASEGLSNISFVGFIAEPGTYYASFDVFVFPTHREAAGSAMIDAMYFGLPVIASNVGGIPEFAIDGVNGRLIEPESSEQLIAAIEEAIDKPDWVASVRSANIERAASLDVAAMADRYERLYSLDN